MAEPDPVQFDQRPLRIGKVLEHLDRDDEVEGVVRERQVLDVGECGGEATRAPVGAELAIGQVDPDDRRVPGTAPAAAR